jgi:hypothetical protein
MTLGWAKGREDSARLIIDQSTHDSPKEPIYHPTLVGEAFFAFIGVVSQVH